MVVGLYLGDVYDDTLVRLGGVGPQGDGESVTSLDGVGGVTKVAALTGTDRVFCTALAWSHLRSTVKCM